MSHTDTIVILTTGKEDRGARAVLAFSWACAALAMGSSVTLFMTMDGSTWAGKGACKGVEVAGFEPLDHYLEQFLALGGKWKVCAPCTQYYCGASSSRPYDVLHSAVEVVGLTTLISEAGPTSHVITF
jgi:predicted peroxiredoxin